MEIGAGSHTYRVDHSWAYWGTIGEPGFTHGVAVDRADRVYVLNQSTAALVVFTPDGEIDDTWGAEFAEGAHGLRLADLDGGEFLFITDIARGLVAKVTIEGDVVFRLGAPDRQDIYDGSRQYRPTDVAVARDGSFFVADGYGQHWVHRYSADGELLDSFGGRGTRPGQFDQPHGIWLDERDGTSLLYVADRVNQRIQVLTVDGLPVRLLYDGVGFVCGFHRHGGDLYVPDLHSRITVLDENDQVVLHLGRDAGLWRREGWPGRPAEECPEGSFIAPHAVTVDSRGDIYVVEWVPYGRVTKLTRL